MKYTQITPNIEDNYLEELLIFRGIENIEKYKRPTKDCELNPFLFDNMTGATSMLNDHLSDKIGLIVDSDCDGFTSAAIMYQYIKDINSEADIVCYLHEGKGHGLEDVINRLDDNITFLIIPDASSNDYEMHLELANKGVEILILDHHEADHVSENALVINNQLCTYPNKELTGAGVVYKFCEAYDAQYGHSFASKYIDLAAVGIIGDMADIRNLETRYIIETGLRSIQNPFIDAIIEKQAYSIGSGPITPTAISFYVVPLINALIRVGKQSEKETMFKAFIEGQLMVQSTKRGAKEGEMEGLGQQAARMCVNAKSRQTRQKDKAIDNLQMTIEKNGLSENKIIIVPVEDDSIDTTLTGLIAMQLVSKYRKPVLVGRESTDGFLRGSLRGPDKTELTDLRGFLVDSGMFEYAEGHAMAAGFSLPIKSLESFTAYANEKLANVNFNEGVYSVDFVKSYEDDFAALILEMGENTNLWAKGNEEPYIVIKDLILDPSQIQFIGGNKDTVKFNVAGVDFLKFKDTSFADKVKGMKEIKITVLGRANLNNFMGNVTPQLFIEDYDLIDSYYEF